MGLIDFVKDAGEKLSGIKDDLIGKGDPEVDEQAARQSLERLKNLGIGGRDVAVAFQEDIAVVTGSVKSQAERERIVLTIGNTKGVARVDDRLTVEKPEPEATYYTVKKGDSLSKIAKAHYGDPMKYPEIFEANQPMLSDPDKIYPGQVLRIPPKA